MNESYHPFKSERAKEKYLAFYDARAKLWPASAETKYVDTSYGQTYVRINGLRRKPTINSFARRY